MRLQHLLAFTALQVARTSAQNGSDFMDYVDPLIGTVDGGEIAQHSTSGRKGANEN